MALDFRKRLPEDIISNRLFQAVESCVLRTQGLSQVDIEHILWELNAARAAFAQVSSGTFAAELLATNQIRQIIGDGAVSGQSIIQVTSAIGHHIDALADKINALVYKLYSKTPSVEELDRTWMPLLTADGLQKFDKIDVVTTNYDMVLETAIRKSKTNVSLGYADGIFQEVDINQWAGESQRGLLTKLHGSVDWMRGEPEDDESTDIIIRRGNPNFYGNHSDRLILYPGFKGMASREPFNTFHTYFRKQIRAATHILFIGFAFRDEHIETILQEIGSNGQVANWNPADQPERSYLKDALHIKEPFGAQINVGLGSNSNLPSKLVEWLHSE
ncbi:SIR2 family protein [Massilia sp. GCM10020059]|uniref:SIR2 family protein n=1 Tax=Massilia agrisoli TaxID=2892444 RepID=A0ABS8IT62_9BURK|nr:SIR2 family protein [Massilia agrisoli]MCC6071799.1 SIR2 family protein [Massilia agrisoli]